jgi:hypothetical protein
MNTAPIKTEEVYPFNLRKGDTIMIAPACYDDMEAMPYTITKIKPMPAFMVVSTTRNVDWVLDREKTVERVIK